jgi:hypothetical protein
MNSPGNDERRPGQGRRDVEQLQNNHAQATAPEASKTSGHDEVTQ